MVTPAPEPTVADLLAYMQLGDYYTSDDAAEALTVALDTQASVCEVVPYTATLALAAKRRAAKLLVAKAAPLGTVDGGQFGSMFIPRWDTITEDLEKNYRRAGYAP